MSILKNIYSYFEEGLCCAMLGTMILCLTAQVLCRMTVGTSIAFTEELSRYTFLWSVYLGVALVAKYGSHVRVTAQFLWMKDRARLVMRMLTDVLWIAALLYTAFCSLPVIEEGFEFPEVSPTMHFVKAWVECIIPFSFVLTSWRIVEGYWKRWKNGTLYDMVRFEEEM